MSFEGFNDLVISILSVVQLTRLFCRQRKHPIAPFAMSVRLKNWKKKVDDLTVLY